MEEVPKEGDAMKIQGSAMVCVAASKEEVIEKLKKDVYAESGVWDFSKVCACLSITRLAVGREGCLLIVVGWYRSRFILSSVLSGMSEGVLEWEWDVILKEVS